MAVENPSITTIVGEAAANALSTARSVEFCGVNTWLVPTNAKTLSPLRYVATRGCGGVLSRASSADV
jgi:hypothetical protein